MVDDIGLTDQVEAANIDQSFEAPRAIESLTAS